MTKQVRVCRKCLFVKPLTEFTVTDKKTGALKARCKSCEAARVRAYYAAQPVYREKALANSDKWARANPEKAAVHRRKSGVKWKYNITHEQYEALLAAQGGCCALCGASEHGHKHSNGRTARLPGGFSTNWPIDHCHEAGHVRGLLCHACNVRLGGYEALLRQVGEAKLLEYLSRPSPVLVAPMPEVPAYPQVAEAPPRYVKGKCSVEGCDDDQHAKDLCFKHYMRARRGADVTVVGNLPPGGSKLTDDDVRAIRASTAKVVLLAADYRVSSATISMIRNRKIWKHVE